MILAWENGRIVVKLDPNNSWDAAYLDECKESLRREIAWQDAEIAKGSDFGKAILAARRRLWGRDKSPP